MFPLINEQQRYRYSGTIGTFSFLQSPTVNTFPFNNDECSDFNFQFILTSLQLDKNSYCPRLLVSFLFFTLSKMYRSIGQIAFRCHFVDFKFLYDVHYDAVMTWRHKFFFRLHRTLVFVSGTYHQTFCSVHRTLAWPLDFEMTTGLSNVTIYVYI